MFMRTITITIATVATAAAFLGSSAIQAATLSSGAYAAGVKVGAISTVSADAIVGQSSAATPGAYNINGGVATIAQTANLAALGGTTVFDRISSGIVTTNVASNGTTSASGSVTVANPTLQLGTSTSLLGIPAVLTALGISADALSSTSSVSAVNGKLVGTGTSTIANLGLTGSALAGLNLNAGLLSAPAANTVVFSLAGLTLTLNEQIVSGNGLNALSMQTNALHLGFDNYLLGGSTLNGNIILGHSEASIAGFTPGAVPEPASWAMMIGGFGMIGGALRHSRRKVSVVLA